MQDRGRENWIGPAWSGATAHIRCPDEMMGSLPQRDN